MQFRKLLYTLLLLVPVLSQAQTNISSDTSSTRRSRLPVGYKEPVAMPGGLYLLDRTKAVLAPLSLDQVISLRPKLNLKANANDVAALYTTGKNKFNPAAPGITTDVYLTHLASLTANTAFSESDYTAVKASTVYITSVSGTAQKQYVTMYDSSFTLLPVTNGDFGRTGPAFTTTAKTAYVRMAVPKASINAWQLEEASSATAFTPFLGTLTYETRQARAAYAQSLRNKALSKLTSLGKNLYSKTDAENSATGYYITTAGVVTPLTGYFVTHYIPVSGSTQYTAAGSAQNIAYFDSTGSSLGVGAAVSRGTQSFTTSADTRFVRATVSEVDRNQYQIETGSTATTVVDYVATLSVTTPQASSAQATATTAYNQLQQARAAVTEVTAKFSTGKNLYNSANAVNTLSSYVDNLGIVRTLANYQVSDYVPVSASATYVTSGNGTSAKQYVAFFDSLKVAISSTVGDVSRANPYFTTPARTRYLRMTVVSAYKDSWQLESGTAVTGYESYSAVVLAETPTSVQAATQAKTALSSATTALNYVQKSQNLFNLLDRKDGGYLTNTSSVSVTTAGFSYSGFIPVTSGLSYIQSKDGATDKQYATFFKSDSTLLSSAAGDFSRATIYFTAPVGAAFVKISFGTASVSKIQLEVGTTPTRYRAYFRTVAPDINNNSPLQGKTIILFGTSIPAQGGQYEYAAARLGAILINNAIGGSTVRKAERTGGIAGNPLLAISRGLAVSLAEKRYFIANYSTGVTYRDSLNAGFYRPTTLSPADTVDIVNSSYERRIDPYLNGTYPLPDLWVFDHGFNDRNYGNETATQFQTQPTSRYDRNTYLGGMNFLIDRILNVDPRARIIIVSHYSAQARPELIAAQQLLADSFEFPFIPLYKKMGLSQQIKPNSGGQSIVYYVLSDHLHLESDPTGRTSQTAGRILTAELANNY